jgi:NADH-quinone oxidoreductase subunit M
MAFLGIGILSWITFLPVLGMIIVLLLPKENGKVIRWTSLGITLLQVVLAVVIYQNFDRSLAGVTSQATMQFVERASWIDISSVGSGASTSNISWGSTGSVWRWSC